MAALVAAGTASAAAPGAVEEAKKHFTRSKELYDDGDFAGALNELQRSYQSVPNYKLLYNMGQIHAQMQNHAQALAAFKRFIAEGGNDIADGRRAEVLKEIDKLRTRVAELTIVVSQPGAEISVDDIVVGTSPLADPITVNIGRRKVSATLPDHFPATKQLDVAGLDTPRITLELRSMVTSAATPTATTGTEPAATVAVKTEAPAPPAKPFKLPVWVPWAGAVVLGAATAVTGVMALDASKKQTALLNTYGVEARLLAPAAQLTKGLALTTDILAGVSGAVAVTALLYTIFHTPDEPAPATALRLGVGLNSLVLSGAF